MFVRTGVCTLLAAALVGICVAQSEDALGSTFPNTTVVTEVHSRTPRELESNKGGDRLAHQHSAFAHSFSGPETCPFRPPVLDVFSDFAEAGTTQTNRGVGHNGRRPREGRVISSGARGRSPGSAPDSRTVTERESKLTGASRESGGDVPNSGAVPITESPFDAIPHFLTPERWARMTDIYGFGPLKPHCELCRFSEHFCTRDWDCREFCGEDCRGLGKNLTDELKCRWCGAEAARCVVWSGCRQGCPQQCGPVLENRKKFFETGVDEMAEQERKRKLRRRLQLFREGHLRGTEAEELVRKQLQSSRPEDKQLQEVEREERDEKEADLLREARETCRMRGIVSILAQGEQRAAEAAERAEEIEHLDLEENSEDEPPWN
ncbi:hypothetical protein TGVAND_232140 [Toxoplasma gondii VAND]|uniref:Transmembrane protein n=1 Tax=Toxoplasma gondii VAND TaxID=933077 RepID=A0A086QF22_TOXGO|nr:hypothetical protein TGVAND_232140 [Toxoplasma gondii VAND]